jgi:hypothetical protein
MDLLDSLRAIMTIDESISDFSGRTAFDAFVASLSANGEERGKLGELLASGEAQSIFFDSADTAIAFRSMLRTLRLFDRIDCNDIRRRLATCGNPAIRVQALYLLRECDEPQTFNWLVREQEVRSAYPASWLDLISTVLDQPKLTVEVIKAAENRLLTGAILGQLLPTLRRALGSHFIPTIRQAAQAAPADLGIEIVSVANKIYNAGIEISGQTSRQATADRSRGHVSFPELPTERARRATLAAWSE